MLAENGETKKLEIDMKRSSDNIRSVIKARGLHQRSNVVGRTFAVFRMDATKHLLSLISKIIPSPYSDPFNRLSGYEKQKGYPPKTNHPSSPKYNPYKEMGYQETLGDDLEQSSPAPESCETTSWGDWSDCSTACGTGTRTRTRRYVEQQSSSCSADLMQTSQCEQRQVGRRRKMQASDRECDVAAWTEWSPCSVTCGQGYKIRTRVYTMPFVPNRICDIRLTQKQDCRMATCWNSRLYDGHDDHGVRTEEQQHSSGSGDSAPISLTIVEQPRQTFCVLEPAPGACKVSTEQWFYNATEATCARFMYSGCGGNKNNFNTA